MQHMFSTSLGATGSTSTPLSPSAQATLSKHLPKLNTTTRRLLQQQQKNVSTNINNNNYNHRPVVQTAEAACLTDLCSSENLPEVEIFSLLEEQIPKYRVRSDFLTDFAGYTNEDWFVPAPALRIPSDGLGLTKEQTRETLNYFLLCGNRVSQMTRAYDDIEAVTRLLEEKEKDLELTVQIGKELLTQNNALETRINDLEADLKSANDDRAQLLHELHKKNELIAVLTNDADEGNETDTPTFSKSITLDLLQKKIADLQNENKTLKNEASVLASKTDEVEEHERRLMANISAQMSETNLQFDAVALDLERQREENRLQYEQLSSYKSRLAEAEMRLHQLTQDNEEHISLLHVTQENQNALALELVEFKKRYEEVLGLLHSAQDQLKQQRKKIMPQARSSFLSGCLMSNLSNSINVSGGSCLVAGGMLQPESLQSELMESSMYSVNSIDSGISGVNQNSVIQLSAVGMSSGVGNNNSVGTVSGIGAAGTVPPYKRVFDTVRCASKSGNYADSGNFSMSQLGATSLCSVSGPRLSSMAYPAGSYYRGSNNSMGIRTQSQESIISQSDDDGYPTQPSGVPGAPGAKELEAAIKRLTPAEVLARRAMLSYAPVGTYNYDEQTSSTQGRQGAIPPIGVRTPDSIMSTGSSAHMSISMNIHHHHHYQQQHWRLPEKLQIIKPLEGSQTLHHWSRLATPTLSGLLEERPGVTIRGGRGLDDLGMQVYTLSDVEEDVAEELPGKQFQTPGCTFTYTNSMVMHPDDGFVNDLSFLSQSQMSSRMASTSTSRQPSCPATPHMGLSRKNSCSTFSVNLGLASMLNERGIKAVTPSALNTPAGPNYTPTVTPCNSPEGSPPRAQSPEPLFGLLSTGADLIRRKLVGSDIERPNRNQQQIQQNKKQQIMLSRLERRALRSLKLMEKVESIGLENIITTQANAGPGIANRSSSPMSHMGSLKSLNANVDDLHFDRKQIKGVLHKGLTSAVPSVCSSTSACNSESDEQMGAISIDDQHGGLVMKSVIITTTTAAAAVTAKADNTTNEQKQGQLVSATETRLKQMQRQKSRRNLKNGLAAQRPDLGRVRSDLGKVSTMTSSTSAEQRQQFSSSKAASDSNDSIEIKSTPSLTQAFVGSVSSLLFGRKGGWL